MLTIALDRLDLAPGDRVLDLGCGRGRHLHALADRFAETFAVGVDLSADDIEAAREGFAWLPGSDNWGLASSSALAAPFANASFDAIVCSEVLEHIHDYETALAEIARTLRSGGVLALSVPRGWPEAICWRLSQEYPKTPGGHVRIFNANALRRAVEANGFSYIARHFAHGLHSPFWWLKCLVWRRSDDHPLVRAYQRFLEWDIIKRPFLTRALAALADPIMGKSVVMYFRREEA